ncbi:hypothetical protein [Clostridium sp.]|uniref:hypothetical protein n=1 Tax=Clostridium sp. TaxID=1506 RepID=UPI00283F3564|nr:hypothetical protein [Clostridium sp.]MDR3597019.1 hypothetical protein [Clostridium sp.]
MKTVHCLEMSELCVKDIVDYHEELTRLESQINKLKRNYDNFDGSKCMCLCGYDQKVEEITKQIDDCKKSLEKCEII